MINTINSLVEQNDSAWSSFTLLSHPKRAKEPQFWGETGAGSIDLLLSNVGYSTTNVDPAVAPTAALL